MNPYQRIIRDGVVLQPGHVDTQKEFSDLTAGIDLQNRFVLDVGCNLGEMCRLAKDAGAAYVCGIDKNSEFIWEARKLNPDVEFKVSFARRATGNYDVAIAAAVFHYVTDQDTFFNQIARCAKILTMSVWIVPGSGAIMVRSDRGLWVPTREGFEAVACGSWGHVHWGPRTVSPDLSERWIVRLTDPRPNPARVVLIYGMGGSGKSTRARAMLGFEHLQLDSVFLEWRHNREPSESLSVFDFVEAIWRNADEERIDEYLKFHETVIRRWLLPRCNLDVVIEGYDMIYPRYREMVNRVVQEHWRLITEIDTRTS